MTTEFLERCGFPHSHPKFLESPSREMVELLLLELVVGKQKLKDIEETWTLDNFRKKLHFERQGVARYLCRACRWRNISELVRLADYQDCLTGFLVWRGNQTI